MVHGSVRTHGTGVCIQGAPATPLHEAGTRVTSVTGILSYLTLSRLFLWLGVLLCFDKTVHFAGPLKRTV